MQLNRTTIALLAVCSFPALSVDTGEYYENVSRTTIDNVVVANSMNNNMSSYCTGTVLGGNIVLTAAHCGTGTNIDTSYQGAVSVSKTERPSQYVNAAATEPHTGYMDVAVWTLASDVKHKVFSPLTPNELAANTKLTMYGYGQTNPTLNAIQQRYLPNWRWGGSVTCDWSGAVDSGDGYCETIPAYEMVAYEINKGRQVSGDSGMAYFTPNGYIAAVHHSSSVRMLSQAIFEYHEEYGTSNIEDIVSADADLTSSNGSWGHPLTFVDTQTFILNAVNAWNYPSWIPSVGTTPVSVQFQSLHSSSVNLFNTLTTTGDVNIDYASVVCFEPEQESNTGTHHSANSVEPFEVCSMDVTSNGGSGEIVLASGQVIRVNTWNTSNSNDTDTSSSSGGGDSSGGSMGGLSLLTSLALVWFRRKERKNH